MYQHFWNVRKGQAAANLGYRKSSNNRSRPTIRTCQSVAMTAVYLQLDLQKCKNAQTSNVLKKTSQLVASRDCLCSKSKCLQMSGRVWESKTILPLTVFTWSRWRNDSGSIVYHVCVVMNDCVNAPSVKQNTSKINLHCCEWERFFFLKPLVKWEEARRVCELCISVISIPDAG